MEFENINWIGFIIVLSLLILLNVIPYLKNHACPKKQTELLLNDLIITFGYLYELTDYKKVVFANLIIKFIKKRKIDETDLMFLITSMIGLESKKYNRFMESTIDYFPNHGFGFLKTFNLECAIDYLNFLINQEMNYNKTKLKENSSEC